MTPLEMSAPKADALPDCATPRQAKALSFRTFHKASVNRSRGIYWQNKAGFGSKTPGIVPNCVARPFPRLTQEAR